MFRGTKDRVGGTDSPRIRIQIASPPDVSAYLMRLCAHFNDLMNIGYWQSALPAKTGRSSEYSQHSPTKYLVHLILQTIVTAHPHNGDQNKVEVHENGVLRGTCGAILPFDAGQHSTPNIQCYFYINQLINLSFCFRLSITSVGYRVRTITKRMSGRKVNVPILGYYEALR